MLQSFKLVPSGSLLESPGCKEMSLGLPSLEIRLELCACTGMQHGSELLGCSHGSWLWQVTLTLAVQVGALFLWAHSSQT